MKKGLSIFALFLVIQTGYGQLHYTIKAGGGPSWMSFPKVFLQDPVYLNNTWEIAPAATGGTFYIGGEVLVPMGEHWGFRSELNVTYISGEVYVDALIIEAQARKLQSYTRIDLPLLFSVKSKDNFWCSFGPVVFFTVHDNKGFEKAINILAEDPLVDSDVPIGVQARLAVDIKLQEHLFLELKFDYDIGKYFKFEDNTYKVRMSAQGVTGGLTYLF